MDPAETHRICIRLAYDGGAFHGWQLQARERTVQGELERVLSRLLNEPSRATGSGRTDRGVHATGQMATVDVPRRWSPEALRRSLNALLPRDVWVAGAWPVAPEFHPRYDATLRSYVYRVGWDERAASPFHSRWCWAVPKRPDLPAMQEAASALAGDHSFRAFAKAGQEERGDRCVVTTAEWREWSPLGGEFHISANRFLHHMVRYLVGTMAAVGWGERPASDVRGLLDGAPGLTTSPPAPPQGLFLVGVKYPDPPYGPPPAGAAARPGDLPSSH